VGEGDLKIYERCGLRVVLGLNKAIPEPIGSCDRHIRHGEWITVPVNGAEATMAMALVMQTCARLA
jgi:hypothetical protein